MKDKKTVVSQNLALLRRQKGITQAELAETFNYSDKAICRWERGDTLPDINVLCALCEYYGVTMNDLVNEEFSPEEIKPKKTDTGYRVWLCILLGSVVWLCATVWFSTAMVLFQNPYWLAFIWAVPATCIVVAHSLRRVLHLIGRIIIYSLLSWSTITAFFLHMLVQFDAHLWSLFLVGIPLQAFVILWQRIKHYRLNF
ncbi:MAG: helix-turn-helix transcriptional regulator [Clostridia bacterium]|nr:helix-turn-helix transcriptional regulator [Clostridia bacterium]